MTDNAGLVERLWAAMYRAMEGAGTLPAKQSVKVRPSDWHALEKTVAEAAQALTAAEAEIARLTREVGNANVAYQQMNDAWLAVQDEIAAAEATIAKQAQEIAALREAVLYLGSAFSSDNLRKDVRETLDRARSLANTKGSEDDR